MNLSARRNAAHVSGYDRGMRLLLAAVLLVLATTPAYAQAPQPVQLADVGFTQRLDEQMPLDARLRDEQGRAVRLGELFNGKPVLLTFNYFHCTNLCPLMLEELTKTLRDLDFTLGQEYRVITISIDPAETTADAAQKKQDLLALYDRADVAAEGWHFLLAAPTVLTVLAQAAGLHYAYNGVSNEYAHPLGVLVLTPQGKIARYLYGLDIPAQDVRLALLDASQGNIGTPIDQIALFCYHYDPATGSYSAIALDAARWAGIATVIILGLFLGSLWRMEIIKARGHNS